MATQVAVAVEASPISLLAAAFTSITDALEAHQTHVGTVASAKESETRASEALTLAMDRSTDVKATAATGKAAVVDALDTLTTVATDVRSQFTA